MHYKIPRFKSQILMLLAQAFLKAINVALIIGATTLIIKRKEFNIIDVVPLIHALDAQYVDWIAQKSNGHIEIFVFNMAVPFLCYIFFEVYIVIFYFAYVRTPTENAKSTSYLLKQGFDCRTRFWAGFTNAILRCVISFWFTLNSVIVLFYSPLGGWMGCAIICILGSYLAAAVFYSPNPHCAISPAIGLTVANILTLGLSCAYGYYSGMLWLSQLICVALAWLVIYITALFISPKYPSFVQRYVETKSTVLRDDTKHARAYRLFLGQYLGAVNMPKQWLLATHFFQYTQSLWPWESQIILAVNCIFFTACCLTNIGFVLTLLSVTRSFLYKLLPPVSVWLRFEISMVHYITLLWVCYKKNYSISGLRLQAFMVTVKQPYAWQKLSAKEDCSQPKPRLQQYSKPSFDFNFDFPAVHTAIILTETDNINSIKYNALMGIAALGFQLLLSYYILGLELIPIPK